MINDLDYKGMKFPDSKKYCKIERQNNICINVFCGNSMDLLLITDKKGLIMCISKTLTDLCTTKRYIYICVYIYIYIYIYIIRCHLQCFISKKKVR